MRYAQTKCGTCEARVYQVTMPDGEKLLVDAYPHPRGTIVLLGGHGKIRARLAVEDELVTQKKYQPHRDTCPGF